MLDGIHFDQLCQSVHSCAPGIFAGTLFAHESCIARAEPRLAMTITYRVSSKNGTSKHPAHLSTLKWRAGAGQPARGKKYQRHVSMLISTDRDEVDMDLDGPTVHLTNLRKPFWPDLGIRKGDLLQYYADVAPVLLPHLRNRAMVMKRYPNGAKGS